MVKGQQVLTDKGYLRYEPYEGPRIMSTIGAVVVIILLSTLYILTVKKRQKCWSGWNSSLRIIILIIIIIIIITLYKLLWTCLKVGTSGVRV